MKILTTRARAASLAMSIAGALLLTSPLAHPAVAASPDQSDGVDVYERDVYVIVGSTLRNPTDTTDAGAPLFNDSGVNLGLT